MSKKTVITYTLITLGSIMYAVGTNFFIFPDGIILGGTSGLSVILNHFLSFSPAKILTMINTCLLIAAFAVLGIGSGFKTLVGSTITTFSIGILDSVFPITQPLIGNPYISVIIGAAVIAAASAVLFYVDSSSGGTDIIALIIKKFTNINIGKACLIVDILIVIAGGVLSGLTIAICSVLGIVIKSFGIDFVMKQIKKKNSR